MKPEWWTNGKACSRIPRVIEIWREQGCEVTPLYSGGALLDAHQRGRREGLEEVYPLLERLRSWIEDEVYAELPFTAEEQDAFDAIRAKAQEVTE